MKAQGDNTVFNKITKSLLGVAVGTAFSASAMALVTVDGINTAGDSWDAELNVDFAFDGGKTGTGFLKFGESVAGNQVLFYSLPKQFVDISFGSTAVGWGTKGHKYKSRRSYRSQY